MNKKINVVTKAEYDAAGYALPKTKALVDALAGIDRQVVSCNANAYAEVKSFESRIAPIYKRCQEVISRGNEQYENRDKELICKVTTYINNHIPKATNLEKVEFKHKIKSHGMKVDQLKKEGFTQAEIDQITPPITEEEHKGSSDKIKQLEMEREQLFSFINNKPEFNPELLKGTTLYPGSADTL